MIDSSSWTGLPSCVRRVPDGLGDVLTEADDAEIRRDMRRQDVVDRWNALKMLWGPAIRNAPRDRRVGWTVYDGHVRNRAEEWTIRRAIAATIGILLDRRHLDRHGGYLDSVDLGHWDSHSDGYGWSAMCLNLYPRGRVSIFSDGEMTF